MTSISAAGVVLALGTAALWAFAPLCMASAGRRIGAQQAVVLRVVLAAGGLLALLALYALLAPWAILWPSRTQVFWLAVSGLTGMGAGDMLLYRSLVASGPRRTTQLLTLAPVASVALGWLWLHEALGPRECLGAALVLGATAYAVLRPPLDPATREPGAVSVRGIACAVGGAILVGVGAVTARRAFRAGPLDPLAATTVRVWAAALLLGLPVLLRGQAPAWVAHLRDAALRRRIVWGTLAGSLVGMITYVAAFRYCDAGLVSMLVASSPLLQLPMVALRYRARFGWDVVTASLLAVSGVGVITLAR